MSANNYDAILFLSFGGPEGMDDVMPFLANVLRGKNVPEARMREVAHHYERFGGVSPINGQNRSLIAALETELQNREISLPVYWGNRNWHPMLADTIKQMKTDGIKKAMVFVTSAYASYSGCRQYLEDIEKACAEVENPPQIDKLPVFYKHPLFVRANAEHVSAGLDQFSEAERVGLKIAFTAHSIPTAMADTCAYKEQLLETCRLVSASPGVAGRFAGEELVFQSRSGPAAQPWLEPDILDHIKALHEDGCRAILVHPVGFISDHMEVLYDLDTEARELAQSLDMKFVRTPAAGTHPLFAKLMADLVSERLQSLNVEHCQPSCCAYTPARPRPA